MVAALHDRMPVIVPARGVSFEDDDAVLLATLLFGLLAARLWVTKMAMKKNRACAVVADVVRPDFRVRAN